MLEEPTSSNSVVVYAQPVKGSWRSYILPWDHDKFGYPPEPLTEKDRREIRRALKIRGVVK